MCLLPEKKSIDGWSFIPTDNSITFQYSAIDQNGVPVDMDVKLMVIDYLNFSYIEGYFGDRVFDIEGDVIVVGLFNKWLSGGIEFEDPKVSLFVENSFGFPVRTDFKKLEAKTITGDIYLLESEHVEDGVDFLYPSLDEVGQFKTTTFDFNKDNSNIQQIFSDKVSSVTYDIDALANPDLNPEINGFLTKESYFLIKMSVDLPFEGKC